MNIIKSIITENDCYKAKKKIKPSMVMVHSTASPGIMAESFVKRWNKPDVAKATHFFVDDTGAYQTLPAEPEDCHRAWHCGKSGNDIAVAFEICESKDLDDVAYFKAAYANAVELTAKLCRDFKIPVSSVVCHAEGYQLGIASNHADVMHWFPRHGVDMDDFRQAVADKLSVDEKPQEEPKTEAPEGAQKSALYRVQTGAFKVKENADKLLKELLGKGFDGYVKLVDGYHKVQVGAYSKEANALAMRDKLKAAGYDTHLVVTTKPSDVTEFQPWAGEATARINVRTGPSKACGNLKEYPKLNAGNLVDVIGVDGEWYQVRIADKYVGWVNADYVSG